MHCCIRFGLQSRFKNSEDKNLIELSMNEIQVCIRLGILGTVKDCL